MSASNSLKALQVKKNQLILDLDFAKKEEKEKAANVSAIQKKLSAIKHEIDALSVKELVVSEHAILRYLERVMKIDMTEIKRKILNNDTIKHIDALGAGKFPHEDGFRLVVKDRVVVTIED